MADPHTEIPKEQKNAISVLAPYIITGIIGLLALSEILNHINDSVPEVLDQLDQYTPQTGVHYFWEALGCPENDRHPLYHTLPQCTWAGHALSEYPGAILAAINGFFFSSIIGFVMFFMTVFFGFLIAVLIQQPKKTEDLLGLLFYSVFISSFTGIVGFNSGFVFLARIAKWILIQSIEALGGTNRTYNRSRLISCQHLPTN